MIEFLYLCKHFCTRSRVIVELKIRDYVNQSKFVYMWIALNF